MRSTTPARPRYVRLSSLASACERMVLQTPGVYQCLPRVACVLRLSNRVVSGWLGQTVASVVSVAQSMAHYWRHSPGVQAASMPNASSSFVEVAISWENLPCEDFFCVALLVCANTTYFAGLVTALHLRRYAARQLRISYATE